MYSGADKEKSSADNKVLNSGCWSMESGVLSKPTAITANNMLHKLLTMIEHESTAMLQLCEAVLRHIHALS